MSQDNQQEIDISCPGCNAVFSVPVELCGEVAECTECSAVFEIPKLDEVPPTLNTDSGAIQGIMAPQPAPDSQAATNTVKLSRSNIGMIPSLKDSITFGQNPPGAQVAAPPVPPGTAKDAGATTIKMGYKPQITDAPSAPQPAQGQTQVFETQTQPRITYVTPPVPQPPQSAKPAQTPPPPAQTASKSSSSTQTSISGQQVAQAVVLPAWTKLQLRQGEELQTVRDINVNPMVSASLAALPVLLTIAAVIFAKSMLVLGIVLVLIFCIITFVVALLMAKDSSKRAVVQTNQRVICIVGKERIELKR